VDYGLYNCVDTPFLKLVIEGKSEIVPINGKSCLGRRVSLPISLLIGGLMCKEARVSLMLSYLNLIITSVAYMH